MNYRLGPNEPFLAALAALIALACGSACTQQQIQTPTRSLDRPSDVALVCATGVGTALRVMPIDQCAIRANYGTAAGQNQLYLLVTGNTRGELSAATAGNEDGGSRVLDLDRETPGFSFLPVGAQPEPLRVSPDGSWAVTASRGSCHVTYVDVAAVLSSATGGPSVSGAAAETAVRSIRPRVNGVELQARPTWVELSATAPTATCPSGKCAMVALPGCQLVVEVDLASNDPMRNVTQAVRVGRDGATVIADPSNIWCPAECGQAETPRPADMATEADLAAPGDDAGAPDDGGAPGDAGPPVPDLGLPPALPTSQAYPHVLALDPGRHLLIGDAVTPRLTFVEVDAGGRLGATSAVVLDGTAQGIARVRVSPKIGELTPLGAPVYARFAYVIARDRSVRVVDLLDRVECETNPTTAAVDAALRAAGVNDLKADLRQDGAKWLTERALRCLPVGKTERNPLALTAGILLPGAALPRDVAFSLHAKPEPLPEAKDMGTPATPAAPAAPTLLVGWFAWIIDSSGRIETVNLADQCPQPNQAYAEGTSPLSACVPSRFGSGQVNVTDADGKTVTQSREFSPHAIEVMPHRLRASLVRWVTTAHSVTADQSGAPRLRLPPETLLAGASYTLTDPAVRVSVPALCIVGDGGSTCDPPDGGSWPNPTVEPQTQRFAAFDNPDSVSNETWSVSWEGFIPGTRRSTGRLEFDGTLGAMTIADSTGAFCGRGILAGDKLFLNGCADDAQCSPAQICFKDKTRPDYSPSLCVNRNKPAAPTEPIPEVSLGGAEGGACAPWTRALPRYRVTDVKQLAGGSRLVLEELPLPENPIDTRACATDGDCTEVLVTGLVGTENIILPTRCLPVAAGQKRCLVPCGDLRDEAHSGDCGGGKVCKPAECGTGFICADSQFEPGVAKNRCLRAPLPPQSGQDCGAGCPQGTACKDGKCVSLCFAELQQYEVHTGEAFTVTGDASGFLRSQAADAMSGACVVPGLDRPERLLSGRLPLNPPACPPALTSDWLAPLPSGAPASCLLRRTDGERILRFSNVILSFALRVPVRRLTDTSRPDMGAPRVVTAQGPLAGTAVRFTVVGGYRPFINNLNSDQPVQMPRSMTVGPDGVSLYIVDEGVQPSGGGLRGQVIRFEADRFSSDVRFQVR